MVSAQRSEPMTEDVKNFWLRRGLIVKAGLIDNALPTISVVMIGLTSGISSVFIWVSAVFTGMFIFLFLILMRREGTASIHSGLNRPGWPSPP